MTATRTRIKGELLGGRALRPLMLAQFVSVAGSQLTAIALPVIAVLHLHVGALGASLLFALEYGARGASAPLLGVFVDRIQSKRRLLVCADLLHAIVVVSVPLASALGAIALPQLVAVAALSGLLGGLTDIGLNAALPRLVAADGLVAANSRLAGSRAVGQVCGPAVGGLLVQFLGPAPAMGLDAASYVVSALLLTRLPPVSTPSGEPSPDGAIPAQTASGGFWASLRHGVAEFRSIPILARLALAAAALNLGGAGLGALYSLNAYRVLGLTPSQIGVTMMAYSAASLVAVISASRLTRTLGLGAAVALFAPLAAASLLLVPAARLGAAFTILIVYETLFAFCATVWAVAATTLQQQLVAPDLLGRVLSLHRTVSTLAIPIGALFAGSVAEVVGLQATLIGFAVVAVCGTAAVAHRLRHASDGHRVP